jgi:hypothetical protein
MTPFDFVAAINLTKKDLFAEDTLAAKDYSPFLINKSLSFFPDTILYANEMNIRSGLPRDWQFYFLLNSVSKKKRYSKWFKKTAKTEEFNLVKEYYGYSNEKATEALSILTEEQLVMIKEKLYKGGK